MIARFQKDRAKFEALREAVQVEAARTGGGVEWRAGEEGDSGSPGLLLMNELGVEQVSGGAKQVKMVVFTFGLSVSGSHKAYVWTRTPPKIVLKSLDPPRDKRGMVTDTWFLAHRRIAPDWYLLYSRS